MSVMIAYDSRIIVQAFFEKALEKSGVPLPLVNKVLFIAGTLYIQLVCHAQMTIQV